MAVAQTQTLLTITDAPIKRQVLETRSLKEEAVERGEKILRRLEAQRADQWAALTSTALLLLHRMCSVHALVEEHSAGVVVRMEAKAIAMRANLKGRSAYAPLRELESAGFIVRISAWGNRPHDYEVPMLKASPEELQGDSAAAESPPAGTDAAAQAAAQEARAARYSDDAAQVAAQEARAARYSAAPDRPKPLTVNELDSAAQVAALYSAAPPAISGEKTGAAQEARAGSTMYDDVLNTSSCNGDAEQVFAVLHNGCKMDVGEARKFSAITSMLDALALELMVQRAKGLRSKGGWARTNLVNGTISESAREEVRRRLAPKPGRKASPSRAIQAAFAALSDEERAKRAKAAGELARRAVAEAEAARAGQGVDNG